MKKAAILLLIAGLVAIGSFALAGKKVAPDCSFNGMKLYGKIQFVDAWPDIKVQSVEAFPDLKVKMVDAFPDKCGQWQSVDAFPNLRVKLVDSFPDIKIKFVGAFPGLP